MRKKAYSLRLESHKSVWKKFGNSSHKLKGKKCENCVYFCQGTTALHLDQLCIVGSFTYNGPNMPSQHTAAHHYQADKVSD